MRRRRVWQALLPLLLIGAGSPTLPAQERGPTAVSPEQLEAAIDRLGDLDYPARVAAGRTVRRAPPAQAVPALVRAASSHGDGYVRFRALVLLTGFNDPRIVDTVLEAVGSPNDRLREVAYAYIEQRPNPAFVPRLLTAFDTEQGDFVRPALVRALAAAGADARVQQALVRDVGRGVDHFRSSVIEALGDYRHAWAVPPIIEVAKLEGPLQDDAAIALGKIGDKRALPVLAELQRSAPRETQPSVAAAICLLGVNCSSHVGYLQKILGFAEDNPGYQELLRGAAAGLGAIAVRGDADALGLLFETGVPSQDPVRAPLALAVGLVALRNTPLVLETLEKRPDRDGAITLLAEGFDMLEEDFEEERFFATVRRTYWAAADKSATRQLCERLITRLDF
ncbi:MAG: HEAT repeat domain-containing protein [Vicinamibacterales bacterium]